MLAIIPIPAFSDNYIWLLRDGTAAAVVDPGDAAPVFAYLEREALTLSAIIATHHHNDHVGGVTALKARYPVPVYGPARETIPGRTHAMAEGDRIAVPGLPLELSILDIPGHTAGHIAFVGSDGHNPVAFVGDTLFAAGCGRLFEGTPAQMSRSLAKLAALPDETRCYCGHEYTLANLAFALAVEPGNPAIAERRSREQAKRDRGLVTLPTTMADERATNPFLRVGLPGVRAAAEAHAGRAFNDEVETFAAVREWKNGFR